MSEMNTSMGLAERIAKKSTDWAGSTWAFASASLVILCWAITGPFFGYSDTWQLVINTGTTIVTFLMVFLIQRAQNKDSHAIHLKLNELLAALHGASNRLISAEDLSEAEVQTLAKHFKTLVEKAKEEGSLKESHSIEDAVERHEEKQNSELENKPGAM